MPKNMPITGIIGKKIDQEQMFLQDGRRVPVSILDTGGNIVIQRKTREKEGYSAIQLGFGRNKKTIKPILGHSKKAGMKKTPRFFKEIKIDTSDQIQPGAKIIAADVLKQGDIINATGVSKGKGYAGVVKRHHFKGGPRTHGQSDRERAPGSIGQTTTPGRVYKGKRMAGRMGHKQVTIKNLEVLDVNGDVILVKGLIPGPKGSILIIRKVSESKKFTPLFKRTLKEDTAQTQSGEVVQQQAEQDPQGGVNPPAGEK